MAKKKAEETINLDAILFKCRDILRNARNSGSFFEKRDMMLTLVFLRFIGEKFEDGVEGLRQDLIAQGLDPDDENIRAVVLGILDADYESYEVITENGIVDEWQKGIVVKTGRHFSEIEELLKKMREE